MEQTRENFAFRILLFCIAAPQDPVSGRAKIASWLRNISTRKCARAAWAKKVREVIGGRARRDESGVDGKTAQVLNDQYASPLYQQIATIGSQHQSRQHQTSAPTLHRAKFSTCSTVSGQQPPDWMDWTAWFLRLGAPIGTNRPAV